MRNLLSLVWLPLLLSSTSFAQERSSDFRGSIPDIAEQSVQGVVNISTTQKTSQRFQQDPLFRWFYGGNRRAPKRPNSLGSGVLVSKDGLILTNNHVIAEAATIKVNLADGRELSAEIVGQDPKSDVAVIRLQNSPDDLKPVPIGDSEALRLGETVLAVGNPFGLGHTVTMGIVSAKGRANLDITDYENFIQTDAAINPGNSGGALVNTRGQLVGINTAIFSRSGGYQGIGFAIPVKMASSIMKSLVSKGRVDRGYLGVGIQTLDKRLAKRFDLPALVRGVLINTVGPDTPAAKAGIEAGDIVLSVDSVKMTSPDVLRNSVAMKGAGTEVSLAIWRDGKEKRLNVTLGLLPDERQARRRTVVPKSATPKSTYSRLGLELASLDSFLRRRLGLDADVKGLAVLQVTQGSKAEQVGLRRGDIILRVNRDTVTSTDDFESALQEGGRGTLLRIKRGEARLFVVL